MPIYKVQAPDGSMMQLEGPEGATDEQITQAAQAAYKPTQISPQTPEQGGGVLAGLGNLAAGAVRGAGSIGATLLSPIDAAARAMGVQNDYIGRTDRREAMTGGLKELGADPESLAFKGGKIGAEIAGTLPVGGVLSKGAAMIPGASRVAPGLIEALRTGGIAGGNLATRVAGGAATGGATAGLVNPEDAGTGAVVGSIAGPAMKAVGAVGKSIGENAASKYADALSKFNRQAPVRETLKEGMEAGYVVPPNLVNPSTKNAIIESFSGKQATGQLASVKNQDVTEKLVRESLGLADDAPLTKSALEQIRKVQGGAYQKISELSPQAGADLEALKQARNDAQGWFNAYNRSASPADLAKAKEARGLTDALELQLEQHAKDAGKADLIPALKEARQQIAKTYTVERALNDASGTVNAKVLARLYEKGKPLSGGLETAGKFASAFPSVAQSPQQMGSPAAHNLRSMASLLMGSGGAAAAGPVGIGAAALPFVAGPAARALMFREGAQKALANPAMPTAGYAAQLARALQNPELQKLIVKSAPVISAQ
jgi:hypothetical protein